MSDDDEPKTDPAPSKEPDPAKESKVKRDTSKVRSGKKRVAAKTTKTAKGATARKKSAASAGTRTRLDPNAKVMKGSVANPFKEGTGAYERTQIVLKAVGKTVETVSNLKGLKTGTLANLKRKGVIKVG